VITEFLWNNGERPDTDTRLSRRLKDLVHRALRGKGMPEQTLDWFIDAFDMAPRDARRLRITAQTDRD
jgi:hypothetical protein